jgi:hypothetical protein
MYVHSEYRTETSLNRFGVGSVSTVFREREKNLIWKDEVSGVFPFA